MGGSAGRNHARAVLIITGSMIGDVILSTGPIAEILRRHPGAPVTVVCSPATETLFRHMPAAAEIIPLAKRKRGLHWLDLHRRLKGRRWSHIYDFRDSLAGRLFHGPRAAPLKLRSEIVHKVVEASSIVGASSPLSPVLWLPPAEAPAARVQLTTDRPILALGPGASRAGKTWPVERFKELACRLCGPGGLLEGGFVAVTGGPMDKPAEAAIREGVRPIPVIGGAGLDLLSTAVLMSRATLFVGNDSGMMHLAAAAGAPSLGLFGPTDERRYGPWGARTAVVRAAGGAPVFGKISKTVSATETQMDGLSVDAVDEAATRLLSGSGPRQAQVH